MLHLRRLHPLLYLLRQSFPWPCLRLVLTIDVVAAMRMLASLSTWPICAAGTSDELRPVARLADWVGTFLAPGPNGP